MSPRYRYTARDWSNRKHRGNHIAPNIKEALEYLQTRELVAIDLKEEAAFSRLWSAVSARLPDKLKSCAGSRDLMIFCRQFSTMIQAGITALYALQVLAGQMEHAGFRKRLQSVALSVEQGRSLSDSFRQQPDFFPSLLISMIEAGEAGGVLDNVMERLADHFERQHDLEEKIRSATLYPLFITAVALVVMGVMVFFVLPQFAQIFHAVGLEMPRLPGFLLEAAALLRQRWLFPATLPAIVIPGLYCYAQTKQGRIMVDRLKLRWPLFGTFYRKTLAARFSRTLGVLLGSGVNLLVALELVERVVDNKAVSLCINYTREAVSQGQLIAESLKAGAVFPPLLVEMVRVGEETGALDKMLNRTAAFYEREVSYMVERLGSMLEPVLLLMVGLFVGLLVFSIISPIYQVFQMI